MTTKTKKNTKKNTKQIDQIATKILRLYITCKDIEYFNEETEKDDTFIAYKTQIGKLNMDVKFTKDVEPERKPIKDGYYIVKTGDISLDTRGDYPVLWIRA